MQPPTQYKLGCPPMDAGQVCAFVTMVPAAHRDQLQEGFSTDSCQAGSAVLQKSSGSAWEVTSALR